MHLEPPVNVMHVYEAGNKRSEVQTMDDQNTPYRVIFRYNGQQLIPAYCRKLDDAIDLAKRFTFQEPSPYDRAKTSQTG